MKIDTVSFDTLSSTGWPDSTSDSDVALTKIASTVAPAPSDEKRSAACLVRAFTSARAGADGTSHSRSAP